MVNEFKFKFFLGWYATTYRFLSLNFPVIVISWRDDLAQINAVLRRIKYFRWSKYLRLHIFICFLNLGWIILG